MIWHADLCFVGQRGKDLNSDLACSTLLCRPEGEKFK